MTDEQLAAIRGRLEAATPGPWHDAAIDKTGCGGWDLPADRTLPKAPTGALIQSRCHTSSEAVIEPSNYDNSPWCLPEDREFIAHAPTDIRALLDEVAALRHDISRHVEIANEHLAECERLRGLLEDIKPLLQHTLACRTRHWTDKDEGLNPVCICTVRDLGIARD